MKPQSIGIYTRTSLQSARELLNIYAYTAFTNENGRIKESLQKFFRAVNRNCSGMVFFALQGLTGYQYAKVALSFEGKTEREIASALEMAYNPNYKERAERQAHYETLINALRKGERIVHSMGGDGLLESARIVNGRIMTVTHPSIADGTPFTLIRKSWDNITEFSNDNFGLEHWICVGSIETSTPPI